MAFFLKKKFGAANNVSQAGSSLMACEKQMSAAQTLVFPCAHYMFIECSVRISSLTASISFSRYIHASSIFRLSNASTTAI